MAKTCVRPIDELTGALDQFARADQVEALHSHHAEHVQAVGLVGLNRKRLSVSRFGGIQIARQLRFEPSRHHASECFIRRRRIAY